MNKEPLTVSVFSEILGDRDYLRSRIIAGGFNAVCFEKENVCIDNLKSIQPHVVLVQTDSVECVWRFLWSIQLSGIGSPLMIDSERLSIDTFKDAGLNVPIHLTYHHNNGDFIVQEIEQAWRERFEAVHNDKRTLLVGESVDIRQIRAMLPNIADSLDAVLIVGEEGVGKEQLSRAIVESSSAKTSFVKIDCARLEPGVLVNGAMKKITKLKRRSEWATIVLDKIHLVPEEIQADILMLVDEANKDHNLAGSISYGGIRFIATAEPGLEELVERGDFRKDLYYRINVIPLKLKPLRERRSDIPLLTDFFMIEASMQSNKCIVIPSRTAKGLLGLHDWPGNIDELKGYIHRIADDGHEGCLLKNESFQKISHCSGETLFRAETALGLPKPHEIKDLIPKLDNLSLRGICDEFVSRTEKRLLRKALEKTNWNRKNAASLLNISYKSMLNKMKVYDII